MKRHFREQGSVWIRAITSPTAGNSLSVARIITIEAISSIARRRRENRFSAHAARNIRLLAELQISRCLTVDLTDEVMLLASDLLERHPLRAYDAGN
jgi:predicted nucleic acid-binding protein